MAEALKLIIDVSVGVLVGQADWSATFDISGADWHAAEDKSALMNQAVTQALDVARSFMNPSQANWVRVDWVWL